MNGEVKIIEKDDKKIVVIDDIKFRGKRKIDWEAVETYLKEYVGKCYEIMATAEKYNVFSARMLVRHAEDGKKYLYDILRIKKETGTPLEL